MPAYVISEVRPLNAELFEQYRSKASASIALYGGRYLVRGGPVRAAEGAWREGETVVIVEFPSMDALNRWYTSREYAEALVHRHAGALERRLLFVEGREPSA